VLEWGEVYAGEYDVVVHSHDTTSWHLSLGRLTPPVEDLVLRLPDPAPPLHLEVVDAATGAGLEAWSLVVRQEGGWEELDGSPAAIQSALWDDDALLAVASPGYRVALLRPAALARPAAGEWRARVALERGWSGLFLVRARSREHPVAGAAIVLDGALAGETNASGELWVHRSSAPSAVEVRHATFLPVGAFDVYAADVVTWIALRPP
jgi:hypothetical protein